MFRIISKKHYQELLILIDQKQKSINMFYKSNLRYQEDLNKLLEDYENFEERINELENENTMLRNYNLRNVSVKIRDAKEMEIRGMTNENN